MIDDLIFLSDFLLRKAQEVKEESKEEGNSYLKGRLDGSVLSYELCSRWIKDILEQPDE